VTQIYLRAKSQTPTLSHAQRPPRQRLRSDELSGSKSQQNRSRDYFRLADDPTNMLCSNGEIRLSRSMLETNGQPTKAPAPD
jgi:hypothetical protein